MVFPVLYRSFNPDLPKPIAFSCWKHHLGFMVANLEQINRNGFERADMYALLNTIGGNLLDVYTGRLTPEQIATEVIGHKELAGISDCNDYTSWLQQGNAGYRCITLSDTSRWILRLGKLPLRFIHIHPGRYSAHTVRIRATNLKTALAWYAINGTKKEGFSIEGINQARIILANLSPLGGENRMDGVIRTLQLFNVKKL